MSHYPERLPTIACPSDARNAFNAQRPHGPQLWAGAALACYDTPDLQDALTEIQRLPAATRPVVSPARSAYRRLTAELSRRGALLGLAGLLLSACAPRVPAPTPTAYERRLEDTLSQHLRREAVREWQDANRK
ncbi:MAG: hypothetical protein NVS3B25_32520 [Hymenobacter sp.]